MYLAGSGKENTQEVLPQITGDSLIRLQEVGWLKLIATGHKCLQSCFWTDFLSTGNLQDFCHQCANAVTLTMLGDINKMAFKALQRRGGGGNRETERPWQQMY